MYERQYREKISESTIGRILTKLLKQGKIMPVRFLFGKKDLKKRIFNGHAQRWKFGMKASSPGELIQVDHMTVTIPGLGQAKHFNAICPVTKYVVHQIQNIPGKAGGLMSMAPSKGGVKIYLARQNFLVREYTSLTASNSNPTADTA